MGNLDLYEKVRAVPENAKREIKGGRLVGRTDINPVWRIKTLTEQFGACGIGWKYVIERSWLEPSPTSEIAAFVEISLFIKDGEKWSEAIPGTGGSMYVVNEKSGLYTNDECYKMALTDAISVACKALGVGADVYWEKDKSKYDRSEKRTDPDGHTPEESKPCGNGSKKNVPQKSGNGSEESPDSLITEAQQKKMYAVVRGTGKEHEETLEILSSTLQHFGYEKSKDVLVKDYTKIVDALAS